MVFFHTLNICKIKIIKNELYYRVRFKQMHIPAVKTFKQRVNLAPRSAKEFTALSCAAFVRWNKLRFNLGAALLADWSEWLKADVRLAGGRRLGQ